MIQEVIDYSKDKEFVDRMIGIYWKGDFFTSEDISQEVMISLMKSDEKGNYEPNTNRQGYIRVAVRNRIFDYIRKARKGLLNKDTKVLSDLSCEEKFGDATFLIDQKQSVPSCEDLELDYKFLDLVKEVDEYGCFLLSLQGYGYTYEELAEMYELPIGSVKSFLHELRNMINDLYFGKKSKWTDRFFRYKEKNQKKFKLSKYKLNKFEKESKEYYSALNLVDFGSCLKGVLKK